MLAKAGIKSYFFRYLSEKYFSRYVVFSLEFQKKKLICWLYNVNKIKHVRVCLNFTPYYHHRYIIDPLVLIMNWEREEKEHATCQRKKERKWKL